MRRKHLLFLSLATFSLVTGCRKDTAKVEQSEQRTQVDPSKVFRTPKTAEEITLVENLDKVSSVLKVLYQDKHNLKVVNASVFSKLYSDESIAIKELIFPAKSKLSSNKAFVKYSERWGLSLTKFSNEFWAEASKMKDAKFNAFLNSLDKDVSTVQTQISSSQVKSSELGSGGGNDPSIYFPYNEEFIPSDGEYYAPITTVATATADADEGWGTQPYYFN